jgi:GNAT superfamily N-acetyltransferase
VRPPAFAIRDSRDGDGPGLVELAVASADTGAIRIALRYLRDPIEAARIARPDLRWLVAEEAGEIVGAAQVSFGEAEVEGEVYRSAVLTSLMVHPEHRRKGMAGALTRSRLELAGDDCVVAATIQRGNAASFANAQKWATQIFGKIANPVVRVRSRPPRRSSLEFREPVGDEWDAAAGGLARFEAGWNLRVPETGASLRERVMKAPFGERFRRYVVAVDDGAIVAGTELIESARLATLVIERVSLVLRALNLVLRVIPRDRELRPVSAQRLWHEPGHEDAGRALWEHVRWSGREVGNAVATAFDVRGPVPRAVRLKPWAPRGVTVLAVRSPVRLSEERLLAPLV